MWLFQKFISILMISLTLVAVGCGDGDHDHSHKDHDHKDHVHKDESKPVGHSHDSKFGGVLVEVGNHVAHIELHVDGVQKRVVLYVWDGATENALRIEQPSVLVTIDGSDVLTLAVVENENTGDKVGNASIFACPLDKLAGKKSFNATVQSISIKGQAYKDIKITYPASANN